MKQMLNILKLQMLNSQNSLMDPGNHFGSAISTICPLNHTDEGDRPFEMQ
jgi:hypothetical protein